MFFKNVLVSASAILLYITNILRPFNVFYLQYIFEWCTFPCLCIILYCLFQDLTFILCWKRAEGHTSTLSTLTSI